MELSSPSARVLAICFVIAGLPSPGGGKAFGMKLGLAVTRAIRREFDAHGQLRTTGSAQSSLGGNLDSRGAIMAGRALATSDDGPILVTALAFFGIDNVSEYSLIRSATAGVHAKYYTILLLDGKRHTTPLVQLDLVLRAKARITRALTFCDLTDKAGRNNEDKRIADGGQTSYMDAADTR